MSEICFFIGVVWTIWGLTLMRRNMKRVDLNKKEVTAYIAVTLLMVFLVGFVSFMKAE